MWRAALFTHGLVANYPLNCAEDDSERYVQGADYMYNIETNIRRYLATSGSCVFSSAPGWRMRSGDCGATAPAVALCDIGPARRAQNTHFLADRHLASPASELGACGKDALVTCPVTEPYVGGCTADACLAQHSPPHAIHHRQAGCTANQQDCCYKGGGPALERLVRGFLTAPESPLRRRGCALAAAARVIRVQGKRARDRGQNTARDAPRWRGKPWGVSCAVCFPVFHPTGRMGGWEDALGRSFLHMSNINVSIALVQCAGSFARKVYATESGPRPRAAAARGAATDGDM